MLQALIDAVRDYTETVPGDSPFVTAIGGVVVLRSDCPKPPKHVIQHPALCVVVQGAKSTTVGGMRFEYRAGQALVVNIDVPSYGRIVEASPSVPYLSVVIEFDQTIMRGVLAELDEPPSPSNEATGGIFVADFDGPIEECVLRMMRLLSTPKAIPTLYPAIMRELCYWLLSGPRGGDVAQSVFANGYANRVVAAIHTLRERFAETIRIEDLARIAQMSPSTFYRQFKATTNMTPLQYQKRLRLLGARNLMVAQSANVESAAFEVGYQSASQFSRDYARMFGAPPRRDVLGSKALPA